MLNEDFVIAFCILKKKKKKRIYICVFCYVDIHMITNFFFFLNVFIDKN